MNLREDAHLAYIMSCETWYADVIKPDREHPSRKKEMIVQAACSDGGCVWEFVVSEWDLGGTVTRVEMFSETYRSLLEIPEFFAALAAEQPATLVEVAGILDRLGAVDATERRNPRKPTRRDELVADLRRAERALVEHDDNTDVVSR